MATLINVATPGPALALAKTLQSTGASLYSDASQVEITADQVSQLDSISITAGTWVVVAMTASTHGTTQYNYLNLVSAVNNDSWPVLTTASTNTSNEIITAIIKVNGPTTIYLNGQNSLATSYVLPAMFAVQIA